MTLLQDILRLLGPLGVVLDRTPEGGVVIHRGTEAVRLSPVEPPQHAAPQLTEAERQAAQTVQPLKIPASREELPGHVRDFVLGDGQGDTVHPIRGTDAE
jgi:hypothetical protein